MLRDTSSTPADVPQDADSFTRTTLTFPCSGVQCQAWLYLPKATPGGGLPPVVVAAHGLGE